MIRPVRFALIALAVAAAAETVAVGQSQSPAFPGIEQLMSVQQFRAAGLHKLSDTEMEALNAWLREYTVSVAQLVGRSTAGVGGGASGDIISSRIDGEFTGWDGETIFKLQNGQIWQQSSYAYTYRYAYSPKVLIYRSGAGYKMKVEAVDREINVHRLK